MLFLRTGLPGASKTLNSVADLVLGNDGTRPIYYTNIRLMMLDYKVASSFSGWFYGYYLNALKDKGALKRLNKIITRVHKDDEFVQLTDVPWLQSYFEAHNPLDTWLFWVNKLYSKKQLSRFNEFVSNMPVEQLDFNSLKQFNLHFTHFENAREWFLLPKTSIILIDECQQFFPPRAIGAKVPQHCSEFETHRHKGFDIHLITQDRMLLDNHVRKLTNKHIHYHNPFGGNRVSKLVGSQVFDQNNYFDKQALEKTIVKRPVLFYGSYFSAEMHTHKFKLPRVAIYAMILIVLFSIILYFIFTSPLVSSKNHSTSTDVKSDLVVDEVSNSSQVVSKVPIVQKDSLIDDKQKKFLIDYVSTVLKEVFIDGTVSVYTSGSGYKYFYSFSNSNGDIFDPTAVGFSVKPLGSCMAQLTLYDYTAFITCNPIRKVIIVDDVNEKDLYATQP